MLSFKGSSFRQSLRAALQVIYPETCCVCANDLVGNEKHLCNACAFDLPYIRTNSPDVTKLNQVFTGRVPVETVFSLLNYQKGNQVQILLHAIKYKQRPGLARHLGTLLGDQIKPMRPIDYLVPIPLHPKKERKRGFNQSLVMAEGINTQLQIPIRTDLIRRRTHNESQTKYSKYDRYENVRSIFEVTKPVELENKHVLLVDDVLTTGATLESCAAELLSVAGTRISIATLAARL